MSDTGALVHHFRRLSETQLPRAPFASRLSAVIGKSPDIADLLLAAPPEQRQPVLLLAAIHHDVLLDPGCELAAWFPTTATSPRRDAVETALHRHVRARGAELRHTVATRSTQTNEIGRCGVLLPALGIVADEVGALALVDVGTAAGLNLFVDRYRYRYEPMGTVIGGPSSVELDVDTRGRVRLPERPLRITDRIGIDRTPLDVFDDDATRWLRACIWPDQLDRVRRLDGAIEIARAEPAELRVADAVDGLAEAIDATDRDAHPVVVNSWVLNYLADDRRLAYTAELDRIGTTRDLSWVFAESPDQAHGLPFPDDLEGRHLTALMLVRWRDGERRVEHLGLAHPHGSWLHWAD